MDLPFLVPVPAVGVHITVQGVSRLPDPIEERLPQLVDAVKGRLADVDTFDATLAEPVVGYGGVVCDVPPRERFEAIRDATRRGLDRLVSVPEAGATGRTWRLRTRQAKVRSTRCGDRGSAQWPA
jgi:hypothetical protein